jgi:hypothetical protein
MAHRVSSNLILIDNDSSCHGTTILFRINVQCMVDEAYLVRLLGDTYCCILGWGGADKKIISTRTKRFTVICAMAQRPSSNLILIDVDSLCHGTVKSCAMARRPSSNLILIDVDSLCHGTKC